LGGLLLLGGRLADSARVGRRRALLIGLVGFAAASALSGAATTPGMLVGARGVQGAFAAVLAPTALSLLAVTFTGPPERARAFGIYGAIAASGGAIGLLIGGLLTQYVDWRWCLYVNVPIALVAAYGAHKMLPEEKSPATSTLASTFDGLGLVLGSGGLVALVYGCGQAAAHGWLDPLVLIALAAGAMMLVLFVARERRARAPLLPPRIVFDRFRGAACLSAALATAGMFGAFLFLTYEFQVVLGFTPQQAGLAFLPLSAASLVMATLVAPRLLPRVAPSRVMVPSFLLAALGMAILTRLQANSDYARNILPAEALLGLGIAGVMVPCASLATSGVARHDAGIAAATLNSAQQVGASLGTAVLNTIAAATTAAVFTAGAPRVDALVEGYAAAAGLGVLVLLAGAMVATSIPTRTDSASQGVHRMMSVQRPPARPNRMVWQARLMGVINVPMRLILGLPFATPLSRSLMLLYLTGRKTGKRYVQPVSYVADGDTLLTPGGGRWKLNLKPGECVRARLCGRVVLARPEYIRDAREIELLLRRMQSVNPRITSFVPVGGSGGEIDRARVETAVGYGFALIRWHFDCDFAI
jgi:EmrB/QacA subfamily drug resistance transporter